MLKKPGTLIFPCTCYCPSVSVPNPTPHCTPTLERQFTIRRKDQWRTYATIRATPSPSGQQDYLPWPRAAHPSSTPSPYQILQLKESAPYSKRRFYELVKIYHPDRNGFKDCTAHLDSLSGTVKMERYRLVVAANDILSDPAKRKAYDIDGTGWNGRPGIEAVKNHWGQESKWSGFDTNDSPFRNATWEDWERWYQRNNNETQKPVYISNGGFLTLVVVAVFVGGFGQSSRLEDYSSIFKRKVEQVHDDASKGIRQRKIDSRIGERDQRLQSFLKSRDPLGYDIGDLPEDRRRKF